MYKVTILFIICCFFSRVNGQVVSDIQSSELDKFAEIYLLSKSVPSLTDSIIIKLLKKHNITSEDFGKYLAGTLEKNEKTYSPDIEALKVSIQTHKNQMETEKELRTKQICIQIGLDYDRYNYILTKYKSEPVFQNSLHHHFAKLIE
ncbi:MAG: hypothetical protein IPM42_09145 [Saprospiraceae bacterium]|nr:hypothetical protein [Saprospiraceae bacterium]